jgi:hypothetical protein
MKGFTMSVHEQISQRAYFLWEQAGRPEGRDKEFWTAAENELDSSNCSRERSKEKDTSSDGDSFLFGLFGGALGAMTLGLLD